MTLVYYLFKIKNKATHSKTQKAQAFAIRLTVHHKPQLYMGKPAPIMVQVPITVVCSSRVVIVRLLSK